MSDFSWPTGLNYRSIVLELQSAVLTSGASMGGPTQQVYRDAGYWTVRISGIAIRDRQTANAYRAMMTRLRTGDAVFLPIADPYRPLGSMLTGAALVVSLPTQARATALLVSGTGIDLDAGQYVSVNGWVYLVTEVTSGGTPATYNQVASDSPWDDALPWVDAPSVSVSSLIKIQPPLRAAIAAGTALEFRRPVIRCRLKRDASDAALELLRFASADLALDEAY